MASPQRILAKSPSAIMSILELQAGNCPRSLFDQRDRDARKCLHFHEAFISSFVAETSDDYVRPENPSFSHLLTLISHIRELYIRLTSPPITGLIRTYV